MPMEGCAAGSSALICCLDGLKLSPSAPHRVGPVDTPLCKELCPTCSLQETRHGRLRRAPLPSRRRRVFSPRRLSETELLPAEGGDSASAAPRRWRGTCSAQSAGFGAKSSGQGFGPPKEPKGKSRSKEPAPAPTSRRLLLNSAQHAIWSEFANLLTEGKADLLLMAKDPGTFVTGDMLKMSPYGEQEFHELAADETFYYLLEALDSRLQSIGEQMEIEAKRLRREQRLAAADAVEEAGSNGGPASPHAGGYSSDDQAKGSKVRSSKRRREGEPKGAAAGPEVKARGARVRLMSRRLSKKYVAHTLDDVSSFDTLQNDTGMLLLLSTYSNLILGGLDDDETLTIGQRHLLAKLAPAVQRIDAANKDPYAWIHFELRHLWMSCCFQGIANIVLQLLILRLGLPAARWEGPLSMLLWHWRVLDEVAVYLFRKDPEGARERGAIIRVLSAWGFLQEGAYAEFLERLNIPQGSEEDRRIQQIAALSAPGPEQSDGRFFGDMYTKYIKAIEDAGFLCPTNRNHKGGGHEQGEEDGAAEDAAAAKWRGGLMERALKAVKQVPLSLGISSIVMGFFSLDRSEASGPLLALEGSGPTSRFLRQDAGRDEAAASGGLVQRALNALKGRFLPWQRTQEESAHEEEPLLPPQHAAASSLGAEEAGERDRTEAGEGRDTLAGAASLEPEEGSDAAKRELVAAEGDALAAVPGSAAEALAAGEGAGGASAPPALQQEGVAAPSATSTTAAGQGTAPPAHSDAHAEGAKSARGDSVGRTAAGRKGGNGAAAAALRKAPRKAAGAGSDGVAPVLIGAKADRGNGSRRGAGRAGAAEVGNGAAQKAGRNPRRGGISTCPVCYKELDVMDLAARYKHMAYCAASAHLEVVRGAGGAPAPASTSPLLPPAAHGGAAGPGRAALVTARKAEQSKHLAPSSRGTSAPSRGSGSRGRESHQLDGVPEPLTKLERYIYILDTCALVGNYEWSLQLLANIGAHPHNALWSNKRVTFVLPSIVIRELEHLKLVGGTHRATPAEKATSEAATAVLEWYDHHRANQSHWLYLPRKEEFVSPYNGSNTKNNDDEVLGHACYFEKKFNREQVVLLLTLDKGFRDKAWTFCGIYSIKPTQLQPDGHPTEACKAAWEKEKKAFYSRRQRQLEGRR